MTNNNTNTIDDKTISMDDSSAHILALAALSLDQLRNLEASMESGSLFSDIMINRIKAARELKEMPK